MILLVETGLPINGPTSRPLSRPETLLSRGMRKTAKSSSAQCSRSLWSLPPPIHHQALPLCGGAAGTLRRWS